MLIGHNPALHDLVSTLATPERASGASTVMLDALQEKFPTGTLLG